MPATDTQLDLGRLTKLLNTALHPDANPAEAAQAGIKARKMVDGDFAKIDVAKSHALQTMDEAYWMDAWNQTSSLFRLERDQHSKTRKALREADAERKVQSEKRANLARQNRILKAEVEALKAALDDAHTRLKPPMTFDEMAAALTREFEAQAEAASQAADAAMAIAAERRERATAFKVMADAFPAPEPTTVPEPEPEPEPEPKPVADPITEPDGTGPSSAPTFVDPRYSDALTDEWQRPNDLAALLDVSRNTVKKYMNQLVEIGLAEMRQEPWSYRRAAGS